MNASEGFFPGHDGTRLFYRFFEQPGARDVLVFLHGHGEHSGRYEKFVRHLVSEPYSLAMYDLRGCGRSEGREVYVDDFGEFLLDLDSFTGFLRKEQGLGKRFTLFAHSMGGLIALHWAQQHADQLYGLVLSSPCLGLRLPRVLKGLNTAIYRLNPKFEYKNPVYPPHLTHNPEEVEIYRRDNLIHRKMTAALLSEMLRYQAMLGDGSSVTLPFPVYMLQAGMERVVDSARAREILRNLRAPDKDATVFEGFYHEIFNEAGQERVFEQFKAYLSRIRRSAVRG